MGMRSALWWEVKATFSPARDHSSPKTLGDVLYASRPEHYVSEADWVHLVQRMVAQDQLALRELYDRSHRLVFTLMMRMTHSRETAEELTLDVFHELWLRAPQYRADAGTVLAWVMNQARSRAVDRLRFEHRQKRVNPYPEQPSLGDSANGVNESSDAGERRALLESALGTLTKGERAAIEIAFFGELTHAQVATRLDEPLGTVKTRIRSGLAKLRQALASGAKRP
jgi:RNA polymerase sigma-70 factor, ECF subfamily